MTVDNAEYIRTLSPDFRWLDRENKKEIKQVYEEELKLARSELLLLNEDKRAVNQQYPLWQDRWVIELNHEEIDRQIKYWSGQVKRFTWLVNSLGRRPKNSSGVTDADIRRAKDVPLDTLYEGWLRSVAGRLSGKCPFHAGGKERTASFMIYPNNTFHCFGCSANGDSIDFVKLRQNCGFLDAVRYLTNK